MRKASCLVFQLITINNSREGGKYIHILFLFFHNKNRTIASNTTSVSKHHLCVLQFCTENNDEQPIKTLGLYHFYYNNYNNTDNDQRLPRFYLFNQACSNKLPQQWAKFSFCLVLFSHHWTRQTERQQVTPHCYDAQGRPCHTNSPGSTVRILDCILCLSVLAHLFVCFFVYTTQCVITRFKNRLETNQTPKRLTGVGV